ncbi:MAG: glycosyltransferase [Acholeplasmataceae bacterium]|nr:glycosyltransferase [Acholeplasmataceae bacterium]
MTDEKPTISIILPIYKVEPYLLRCLESIQNQSFSNFEAILVDDGSPDNCGKICEEFAAKDSRFKVIHQANGGIANARNNGMKIAQGKYFGFVDPDDYIANNMYDKLYQAADRDKADIVICDHYRLEHDVVIPRHSFEHDEIFTAQEAMRLVASDKITSYVWCKLYKRELFDQVQFLEGYDFEDLNILHELVHHSQRVSYIHDCLYHYFINPSGVISTLTVQKEYDHFMAWKRRRDFLQKLYPDLADYTYELFTYCGTRSYWLSRYCGDRKAAQEVRALLKSEAKAIIKSPLVRTKQKIRLLEVLLHINLYRFYIPKAIRNGIERIVNK